MNPKPVIPSPKVLFLTSSLPFLTGLLCDGILCFTDPQGLESQRNPLLEYIKQAKDLSYGVYLSFSYFIIAMLVTHLVIQILKGFLRRESPEKVKRGNSFILNLLGYALAYTALYFFFTLLQTQGEKASSMEILQDLDESFTQEMGLSSRVLEEEILTSPKENKKIKTFPLGKVLGSLNIDASSAVFSQDETLLFVSRTSYFGISVVDVSNWENPRILQDSKIAIGTKPSKTCLLLSPDEKTLFASNMENLAVFNLNDLNSITYRLTYQGFDIPRDSNITFEASLALDGARLFASGYEFQVFDVRQKGAEAKLVKAELPQEEFYFSTVAVSGQFLFLLNKTVLEIYDITDADQRKFVSSFESENMLPYSFILSKDGNRLAVIGFEKGSHKVVIEKVNVSNVKTPILMKTFSLNIESFSTSFGLKESPKGTYLSFTVRETETSAKTKMTVFDTVTERLLEDTQNLISKAKSLLFNLGESHVMAICEESILTIQLYQKYPNDRIFSITKEIISEVKTVPKSSNKMLKEFSSSNGKFLLSVDEMENGPTRFTFIDISNRSSPVEINSFSTENHPVSISITSDAKTLSVSFKSSIILYDISDFSSIKTLGTFALEENYEVVDAVFTSDGKTCFAAISSGMPIPELGFFDLTVFDLSDPESIKEIDSLSQAFLWLTPFKSLLALSKDDKTLFMVHTDLCVFDVSARKVTKSLLGSQTIESVTFVPSSISLSPNEKILIIKKEDLQSSCLHLFDVSNQASPKLLSVFVLPKTKVIKRIPVGFSPDGKFVYAEGTHGGQASLVVLNISNPSSPVFQSVAQTPGSFSVDHFIISKDGQIAYLTSNLSNKISLVNLEVSDTVFLGTESFRLGEKSSTDVMVLRQNLQKNYVPLNKNYRFVKASFFSTKIVPTEYSTESTLTPFPYWMTFEKKTGNFVLEPKKQRDLGAYTLYSVFSTQLNHSSFWTITNDTAQIRALLGSLVSLDYLDNQLYVTESLDTFDNFYYTGVESEKVYKILKESCYETFTMFDIVPSLEIIVDSKKKLEVQTPSDNSLKIEIALMDKSFQFLNKQYGPLVPLITENKTRLAIEGSVDDVNNALKGLAVNSEMNEKVCEGRITIWDRLNPSVVMTLKNLSSYFEANEAPRVNDEVGFAIQEQINSAEFYTGKEFSLTLLKNTFIDKHSAETLRFILTLDNKERSSVSDWLTFNDGVLKGTPKKEILKRSVNLILTVSNEFKKTEIPFTMNIKFSPMFILELLMKYSPYILTVVSIWIFANRLYNVIKKSKYRHHKDFYIPVGQEITSQDVYPIRFLGQEGEESDFLWKHLKKEGLGKSKITEEIKKVAEQLSEKDLALWKKGSALSKKLIEQLVLNKMALWLANSEGEKETLKVFEEEIEGRLMDLVIWDCDLGYCKINEIKLTLKDGNVFSMKT